MQFPNNDTFYVDPQLGYYFYRAVDMSIPSRGFDIQLKRHFNSEWFYDSIYDGWFFDFDEHLYIDPYDESIMIKFPEGRALRFEYDSDSDTYTPTTADNYLQMERIANVDEYIYIASFNNGEKHYFDNNGELIKKEDAIGNCITYIRDEISRRGPRGISKIVGPCGREINVELSGTDGNDILIFTDWTGRSYSYTYENNSIVTYTDPEGNEVTYNYSTGMGGFDSITYPLVGKFISLEALSGSPAATKIKKITYASGLVVEYTYDWDAGERTMTKTFGDESRTWTYIYDTTTWFLVSMTDPLGSTTTYTRDSMGRMLMKTDPRLGVTSYTYNSNGIIISITDALGNTTSYEYGDSNWPERLTKITGPDPDNNETVFTYDASTGNLLTTTDPSGKVTTRTYYSSGSKIGLLKDVTDPNSNKITYDYDDFGNLSKTTDALGKDTVYVFDSLSRLKTHTNAEGNAFEVFYDDFNRIIRQIDPLGNETSTKYDTLGRVIVQFDPKGRSKVIDYDVNGNTLKTFDPSGHFYEFEYDGFDNMISLTDPNGQVYTFSYDKKNRMLSKTDPLGRKTEWEYDPYCGTVTKTDAKGQQTVISKDLLCQVTRISYQNDNAFNIVYDNEGRKLYVNSDGPKLGEVIYGGETEYGADTYGDFKYDDAVTIYGYDPDQNINFEYDANGRLVKLGYEGNLFIEYKYDDGGRLTQISDVNGIVTQYSYNDQNNITKIIQGSNETVFSYDDAGRKTGETLPNGIVKAITYDAASHITQIKYSKDGDVLIQLDYEFSEEGNILLKTETRIGRPRTEFSYQYDELSRLIRVDINRELAARYEYDAAGNRLVKEYEVGRYLDNSSLKNSPLYDQIEYVYDAANQIISAGNESFKHDENGNLIEKKSSLEGTTTYDYNRAGRLYKITLPDEKSEEYFYNSFGMRIKVVESTGRTTKFYWNSERNIPILLAERTSTNSSTDISISSSSYSYTDFTPTSIKTLTEGENNLSIAQNLYYLTDHLGTVLALTDANGNLIDEYYYDEYGIPIESQITIHNPMSYTGQYADKISGLVYLRNRYYNPILGLFTRIDPIMHDNQYSYIPNGNPIINFDINGYYSPGGFVVSAVLSCFSFIDVECKREQFRKEAEEAWLDKLDPNTAEYKWCLQGGPASIPGQKFMAEYIEAKMKSYYGPSYPSNVWTNLGLCIAGAIAGMLL